ncbi:UNVERIFIED_CONTAM: hypothetical protein RMT77_009671 [Armadillidium vulgare]
MLISNFLKFNEKTLTFKKFLLRAEVLRLYRSILREIKTHPNESQREDIKKYARNYFDSHRNETDEKLIRTLIANGNKELHELRRIKSLSGGF